jgi:hypothetical protein
MASAPAEIEGGLRGGLSKAFVLVQQSRSQGAAWGKFLDCQALAHFRMSASRSLSDLNSSCLYICSQKAFSSSIVIGFASLRSRSSASKARLASSLVIIAFTYHNTANVRVLVLKTIDTPAPLSLRKGRVLLLCKSQIVWRLKAYPCALQPSLDLCVAAGIQVLNKKGRKGQSGLKGRRTFPLRPIGSRTGSPE